MGVGGLAIKWKIVQPNPILWGEKNVKLARNREIYDENFFEGLMFPTFEITVAFMYVTPSQNLDCFLKWKVSNKFLRKIDLKVDSKNLGELPKTIIFGKILDIF